VRAVIQGVSEMPPCESEESMTPFSMMMNPANPSQVALNNKGINKLLDEAREDNKENDARLIVPRRGPS
jgi:hypothetical protein